MKIIFLCSSLEPGRDGVGDYCRRLGGALVVLGHEVLLVALRDRWVSAPAAETVSGLALRRLPEALPLAQTLALAREHLRDFRPDWLSLQYVCYGYHPKGLPWRWNRIFAQLAAEAPRRHIMFHELWVGDFPGSPWRHRLLGRLQRRILRGMTQSLLPNASHTSLPVYLRMLEKIQVRGSVLPLFGNIPLAAASPAALAELFHELQLPHLHKKRQDYFLGTHFGTWHPGADPLPFCHTLLREAAARHLTPCLLAVGSIGEAGREALAGLQSYFGDQLYVSDLGRQSERTISRLMQAADFGINTGYHELLGKSGAFAAMVEHGLPVMAFSVGPTHGTDSIQDFRAGAWERHFLGSSVESSAALLSATFSGTAKQTYA